MNNFDPLMPPGMAPQQGQQQNPLMALLAALQHGGQGGMPGGPQPGQMGQPGQQPPQGMGPGGPPQGMQQLGGPPGQGGGMAGMNPMLQHLLPLLILAHLAGVHKGQSMQTGMGGSVRQNVPQPQPRPKPKGTPKAQGHRGVAQGRHGAKGPVKGGTMARKNALGMLPQQQQQATNPMLGALKGFGG